MRKIIKFLFRISIIIAFCTSTLFSNVICVFAVNTIPTEDQQEAAEQRKKLPVETNEIAGWPEGPMIGAEGAILMDANSGVILYAKNIHERLYPASTTKLMTALLALENSTMDEIVTFSHDAIYNTDYDSSRIGIDVGEQLTMEQCLYGLLLGSANEVAYAIAEHIGGDLNSFVNMMNERAKELGCYDTHFANANGLPNDDHYTSPYDLCLIARECFKNESLVTISGATRYVIPATNIQPQERPMDNHHQMLKGFKYEYDGVIGGKTGFTKAARQTLVTCAQREGVRLICVIMKEESPAQFTDTAELFDYGFGYFKKMNISDNETRYSLNSSTFFNTDLDIIGSSKAILSINRTGNIVLPKSAEFTDADVAITYSDASSKSKSIAKLTYTFGGQYIGETTLDYANNNPQFFEFSKIITEGVQVIPQTVEPEKNVVFISAKKLAIILGIILGVLILVIFIIRMVHRYIVSSRRELRKKRKRYKKRSDNLYF